MLSFAGNFKRDKRFESTKWLCNACADGVLETQDHVTNICDGYDEVRRTFGVKTDEERLHFFRAVLKIMEDAEKGFIMM